MSGLRSTRVVSNRNSTAQPSHSPPAHNLPGPGDRLLSSVRRNRFPGTLRGFGRTGVGPEVDCHIQFHNRLAND
jgi:hypothetical protein